MAWSDVFAISGSGLAAQSQRLNVVASNLANAESAVSASGEPYRSRQVVFRSVALPSGAAAVQVAGVVEDAAPARRVFDPGHPLADPQGYVTMPNVDVVEEMVNMISAARAYQNNVEVLNTAKTLLERTLQLGA